MVFKHLYIKEILFIAFLFIVSINSYSQNIPSLEDLIESIAENSDSEIDYSSLYEDLNFFLSNPLNLNTAKREDLEKLKILNDFQINSLLDYIKKMER